MHGMHVKTGGRGAQKCVRASQEPKKLDDKGQGSEKMQCLRDSTKRATESQNVRKQCIRGERQGYYDHGEQIGAFGRERLIGKS